MMTAEVEEEQVTMDGNPSWYIAFDHKPEVVAYGCGGMPDVWFCALRVKWALDDRSMQPLKIELWNIAVKMAVKYNWRSPKGRKYFHNMALMAIREMKEPVKYRYNDIKISSLGCSRRQWYERWAERYEKVYRVVEDWSNRGWHWMNCHPRMIAKNRKKTVKICMAKPQPKLKNPPRLIQARLFSEPNWNAMNRPTLRAQK